MNTKTCNKCGSTKVATEEFFYRKPPSRKPTANDDGLNTICKQCVVDKVIKWDKENREKINKKHAALRQGLTEWINELKDVPCVDCGGRFPPVCMDFDHLPEFEKTLDISQARARKWSRSKLLDEVNKCEVVCSNCHRIRTENRRRTK